MPTNINHLMRQFAGELKKIFGKSLCNVIVYGSYARGDYTERSDVDVMILVSLSDNDIRTKKDIVYDLAFDYFMEYDLDISTIIKNVNHFNAWSDTLPFYRNVKKEGIQIA